MSLVRCQQQCVSKGVGSRSRAAWSELSRHCADNDCRPCRRIVTRRPTVSVDRYFGFVAKGAKSIACPLGAADAMHPTPCTVDLTTPTPFANPPTPYPTHLRALLNILTHGPNSPHSSATFFG